MKTYHHLLLLAAALGFVAQAVAQPAAATTAPAPTVDTASVMWTEIKHDTYDLREHFFAGLKQLEARVEVQIVELNAKRAVMNHNNTDTKAWDFAMKEMGDAQSYLRSMDAEALKSSRELWEQKREKVGQAWLRAQEAYGKVKATTTS
jgi:hypothetical protein